jgi:hypothetical protein
VAPAAACPFPAFFLFPFPCIFFLPPLLGVGTPRLCAGGGGRRCVALRVGVGASGERVGRLFGALGLWMREHVRSVCASRLRGGWHGMGWDGMWEA